VPLIEKAHLATISPGAVLAGLAQSTQTEPDGVDYPSLHPKGTTLAYFQLAALDRSAVAAAKLAVAPASAHGLSAHSIFIVNDGTPGGQGEAAAFVQALTAAGGSSAGSATVTGDTPGSAQQAAIDIIRTDPDAVFYAGGTAAGAELRSALTLTGAPQVVILTAAPIANNPGWSAAVGLAPASAYTVALLPGQMSASSPAATAFAKAYHAAYGLDPLPQAAMAYDAAMDEISAIKALIAAGKPITRDAVLARVTTGSYTGVTGTLAFDANGIPKTPPSFGIYACQSSGAWKLVGTQSS
jgi:ABC-type branched-subunit amino acid transport system substrate-binding protein